MPNLGSGARSWKHTRDQVQSQQILLFAFLSSLKFHTIDTPGATEFLVGCHRPFSGSCLSWFQDVCCHVRRALKMKSAVGFCRSMSSSSVVCSNPHARNRCGCPAFSDGNGTKSCIGCLADTVTGIILVSVSERMIEARKIEVSQASFPGVLPHPVSLSGQGGISLLHAGKRLTVATGIHGITGNPHWKSCNRELHPGQNFVHIGSLPAPPGVYLLTMNHAGTHRTLSFFSMP